MNSEHVLLKIFSTLFHINEQKNIFLKRAFKNLSSMYERIYISDSYILKAFFHIFLAYRHIVV
jgi:hypothetical protein